ncbi:transposon TX1 [Tanacetum coccineum]
MRVFIAYDRRNTGNIGMDIKEMDNNIWQPLYNEMKWREKGTVLRDSHRYVDVVHGEKIVEGEEEFNGEVEVKLLGGLEVMIVLDAPEMAINILNNNDHGTRRWLDNIRRWNKFYTPLGRLTWVNIIGVPVSCWTETVFRKIAEVHGSIVRLCNCKLEGNQNTIIGRVQIQSLVNRLINEIIRIKFRGIIFNVKVIEEVSDINEVEVEEANTTNMEDQADNGSNQKNDEEDMLISEDDEEDCESNNCSNREDDELDDDEGDGKKKDGEEQVNRLDKKEDSKKE